MENKELEKHIDELKVLIEKGQYEDAVDYYAINISKKINVENNKELLLELISFLKTKEVPELLLIRSNIYNNLRDHKKALEIVDKAIKINPSYARLYNTRGGLYSFLKEYKKALKEYEKAIQLNNSYAHAYKGIGNVYYNLKEYEKALKNYTKAIQLDTHYVSAYNNRGLVYTKLKEYKKALEDYEKVIQLNDNSVFAYNNRGNTYRELKDYEKAIEDYNRAIALDANYALVYYNKGRVHKAQKQYKKALHCYTKHIELVPDEERAYYQRGEVFQALGDIDNAVKDFIIFDELSDDEYWKAQAKERIEELQEEKDSNEIKNINDSIEAIKSALLFKEILITHYTSISGAKILLLDPVSSFRMSEANFMNDTTEGERLRETVVKKENFDRLTKIPFIEKPFLGSFVDNKKCNDLTLWRMYAKSDGVDGRGCAITLNKEEVIAIMMETFIDEEYLKNNAAFSSKKKEVEDTTILTNKEGMSTDEFGFYKVAYLDEKGKCIGRDKVSKKVNEAIDGLRESFKNILKKENKEELFKIALTRLSEIEYLFKGIEYQHESEVRLILSKTGKGKHIKVDTSEYFEVPRVYLNIGNILSAVDSITIGPKVERPKEWASAFNYNFLEKGMKESKVYISRLPYK